MTRAGALRGPWAAEEDSTILALEELVVARVADETPLVKDIVSSSLTVDHDSSPLPRLPSVPRIRGRLPIVIAGVPGHGRQGAGDHDRGHEDREGKQQTKPLHQ
jgi:hypothetical protein